MTNITIPHCIVVTGASAGIGQALALAYAAPDVVLGLIGRDVPRLQASADACRARGATVVTGCVDVRNADALKTWLDTFDASHPIELLIANAGVASTHDGENLPRITKIIETNFYGMLHTVLPVIERMRARKTGQIALIASLAALRGTTVSPAYCVSKAAIKVWGDAVRPLLKRDGITLSVILPGFVKTAMSDTYPAWRLLIWPADRTAAHIRKKLSARRPEIGFPLLLYAFLRVTPLLPTRLTDYIINIFSK